MLNLVNVSRIASYSTQEIVASLVYRRRFNSFNGEAVVTDLARYSNLWSSFWFTRPVYTPDTTGRGIRNLVEMLLQMASSQQRWSLKRGQRAEGRGQMFFGQFRDLNPFSTPSSAKEEGEGNQINEVEEKPSAVCHPPSAFRSEATLNNSYMADTLYVLASKDDAVVSQLISLGEKWQADSIELIDGDRTYYSRRLQQQLAKRLKQSLYIELEQLHVDAVVISFWWDRSE